MPQFDGTPYTQLTTPARGDIQGVIKDVSEALPENQAKYAALEDMVKYGAWASKVLVVAATGNVTLVDTDPIFVEIDPNGSDRDVSFPAKGNDNHGYFIHHVGGANALTLKRSGGASIGTLAAGEIKYVKPSTISDFSLLSGGGGVSDGDKGDITVSGSGATWTIDNGVVSLAKMANMATASIIGRNTAETGAPEVLSAATARSLLGINNNALINGGFDLFQRGGISSAIAMTDDAYNAPDMWYSLIQEANATVQRVTGSGTHPYSCKLVAGGTTNRFGIAQIIPKKKSISLRGQSVIAQALVTPVLNAGSGTRNVRIAVLEWTGTADAVTSEVVNDWTSGTYTTGNFFASTTLTLVGTASVTATHNTETQLSVKGTVSASCNNLIVFIWHEAVPSHAADYLLVAEAGLYQASTVQIWNPDALDGEKCRMFCQKSYDTDTAPATATDVGFISMRVLGSASSWDMYQTIFMPTAMYSTPSISYWDNAGNASKCQKFDGITDPSNTTLTHGISDIGEKSFRAGIWSNSAMMQGFGIHYLAKVEL